MKCELWGHKFRVRETNPDKLRMVFNKLLEKSSFKILGFMDHHFSGGGYTALWLLGESHFAVHTFPEDKATACEISSCSLSKFYMFVKMVKSMSA